MEIQDYILVHGKIINIKNTVDDKYIERIPRDELGYRKLHEIIYVNGIAD